MYLEHHRDFEFRYFGDGGKVNSTIIKRDKQILGKFGEIQREFVDVYSPDSDNYCRESGGGHHCGTMVRRSGNPPRTFKWRNRIDHLVFTGPGKQPRTPPLIGHNPAGVIMPITSANAPESILGRPNATGKAAYHGPGSTYKWRVEWLRWNQLNIPMGSSQRIFKIVG